MYRAVIDSSKYKSVFGLSAPYCQKLLGPERKCNLSALGANAVDLDGGFVAGLHVKCYTCQINSIF